MKFFDVERTDGCDGIRRRIMVFKKVFSARQKARFASFDFGRIVVALIHCLQNLRFAQGNLVVLKTRRVKHVAQNSQAFVQIFREQIQADRAFGVADVRAEIGGEKREAFLKLVGGIRARTAGREQPAGEFGETFLAGGFEIGAGADVNREVDERTFVVRHDVSDGPGFELDAEIVRHRRLVFERRKRKFFRPVRNVVRAGGRRKRKGQRGGKQESREKFHGVKNYFSDVLADSALRVKVATARFSLVKYSPATRFTSAAVTAWILALKLLISRQSPSPSSQMSAWRMLMSEFNLRYCAAAKLFFTFCNSSAGTSSRCSFSISA